MKKNTASQIVGAQLVSATDGSAVTTGTTTVYVTGDGGTQAAGSVGSGACTHEGQGFWTYAPAQAETNYDHVAFTFVNTAAVNATVQIYPSFPQTGDNYARLGAPAGASVSADVAAIKAETASILTDTAEIGAAGAGLTVLATAANLSTVAGYLDTEIAAILADTNELQTDWANGGRLDLILDSAASAGDPWSTALPGAYGAGTAGKIVGDSLDAAITSRMASYTQPTGFLAATFPGTVASTTNITGGAITTVGSVTGAVGSVTGAVGSVTGLTASDVGAIKAKTDSLTFTAAGNVDANIQYVNDVAIQGTGAVGTDEWRKV